MRFGGQVLPIHSKLGTSAFSGFYSWLVESCIGCTYQIRLKLKDVKEGTQYIASELAFVLSTHHVEHNFEPSSEGYFKVSGLPKVPRATARVQVYIRGSLSILGLLQGTAG